MARSDGFPVMDVSTDILNDPKFRRIARETPELVAPAFTAYVATMAESWKAGRRSSVVDSWPVVIPYDEPVVTAMTAVGLLDKGGQVPAKTWNGWFGPAKERRDAARERWRRANDKRAIPSTDDNAKPARSNGGTSRTPRGDRDVTASTVPLRPYRTAPSVPSASDKGSTAALSLESTRRGRRGEPRSSAEDPS